VRSRDARTGRDTHAMIRKIKQLFGMDEDVQAAAVSAPSRPRNIHGHKLITHNTIGQTLVVTIVERELCINTAADVLYEVRELYLANATLKNIVLDMENLKYVDSAGLNQLVDLLGLVKRRHGRIGIAAATQHVEVLFKLTRLELVFTIRRAVIDAIDAVEAKG
jgi:anti-anti-sigma factor